MTEERQDKSGLSPRTWIGIVIAALVIVFIFANTDDTNVSFVFFDAELALWVALSIAAAGGFGAGFLISRKRYRSK